jgi:hypothetical protein
MKGEAALRRFRGLGAAENIDYEVSDPRIGCLRALISDPAHHYQRFVDQLSFLPGGGQLWERELQVQIPTEPQPSETERWIVPLGAFTQGRLPDFAVTDNAGRRLNLVTRQQHGDALTKVVTGSLLPKELLDDSTEADLRHLLNTFQKDFFGFFTSFSSTTEIDSLAITYSKLLKSMDEASAEHSTNPAHSYEQAVEGFRSALTPWSRATQYLCWVDARPGEMVNLRTSYTLKDPKQLSSGETIAERWLAIRTGVNLRGGSESREQRAKWYRQFGLMPINYAFKAQKKPAAPGSYYFVLKPPPSTEITYMDWELGRTFGGERDTGDIKCAFPSAHIHDTDKPPPDTEPDRGYFTIKAYLRCAPYRHKQILGAAALNMAIVFLLASGSLPGSLGEPLQGLIIAAPSVIIGFITQQQRHYYSRVMRRQRGLLWTYLAISIAFIVAVAFSEHQDSLTLHGVGTVTAWLLGATSGSVFGWQLLLGGAYTRLVNSQTRKASRKSSEPIWELYGTAARKMGAWVIVAAILGTFVGLGGTAYFWFLDHSVVTPHARQTPCAPHVKCPRSGPSASGQPKNPSLMVSPLRPDTSPPPDTNRRQSAR